MKRRLTDFYTGYIRFSCGGFAGRHCVAFLLR